MSTGFNETQAMQVLGTLAYSNEGLTADEIRTKLVLSNIYLSEIVPILDNLRSRGLITEIFTVDNVLDTDSKSSIKYKITNEGLRVNNSLFDQIDTSDPYIRDEDAKKKFNRKVLIGFAVAVIILVGAMIIFIASTG